MSNLSMNLRRLGRIAVVLARHGLAHLAGAGLERWPRLARRLPPAGLSGPERLRTVVEDLEGTFVKFGQMLALQPDILPAAYCNALYDLLDRMAPFAYEQVEKTFVEELGQTPAEIFDSFEVEPLATASVAQVHVAYLDGRKFAVKVQRPNAEENFAGDIRLMMAGIRLLRVLRLQSLYWVVELMSEFINWTQEELDFHCEARYMDHLRRNAHDNTSERVPTLLREYTTRRTLVVEYLEGVTILDYLRALEKNDEGTLRRLREDGFDADVFAAHIIENFFGDVFRNGLFHADLHPANLLILPGNVVGYVDFGISGLLSVYARRKMVAMTLACTRADLEGLCAAFFDISAVDANSDTLGFRRGIEAFSEKWFEVRGGEPQMRQNFTLVMLDMVKLSRRTGVWPDRDVVKYLRSSIAIDGLITRFAPDFSVGQYVGQIAARHLSWEARQSLLTHNSLIDWSNSSARLLRNGAERVIGFLDRLSSGELGGVAERAAPDRGLRLRALCLTAVVFAVSLGTVIK